tara:strand:- start:1211 stop:1411 length:201 start_codon:yes stop_codon:yes gene_type:complete
MKNLQKNLEEYQGNFDKLAQERAQLTARVQEIVVAMEQLRGAIAALKGLEAPVEEVTPPSKEPKKK